MTGTRKTMTEALRDARAMAMFKVPYKSLTVSQKLVVEELMQRARKYAVKGDGTR